MRVRAPSRSSSGPLRISLPRMTFSATVNTGMSWKCWCTMPIPWAMASRRAAELHGLAPQEDLAGVGLVEPEHGVHQRALAGAVLAEQAVDLTLVEGEVHVLVRDDAREGLGEAPHLEDGDASRVVHRDGRARPEGRADPPLRPARSRAARPWPGRGRCVMEPSARPWRVSSSLAATSSGMSASWNGA